MRCWVPEFIRSHAPSLAGTLPNLTGLHSPNAAEAERLRVAIHSVRVTAMGEFDTTFAIHVVEHTTTSREAQQLSTGKYGLDRHPLRGPPMGK